MLLKYESRNSIGLFSTRNLNVKLKCAFNLNENCYF